MSYRILSLDGGGTWALIQVKAMLDIYGPAATGYTVLSDFDLVVANSGGSIVAAALAANMPLQNLLSDFMNPTWLDTIFVDLPFYDEMPKIVGLPWPKYDTDAKLLGLRNALNTFNNIGDIPLDQVPNSFPKRPSGNPPQLLITTFDYDITREVIFRSNLNSPAASAAQATRPTLAQAIHASSNAPVRYFNKPAAFLGHQYWDGAMAGLNNPVLVGITEAIACGAKISDIQIRSIGTGTVSLPFSATNGSPLVQPPIAPGYTTDLTEAATCIIDDPPDEATFVAYATLDGRFAPPPFPIQSNIVVRLNPLVQPLAGPGGTWVVPPFNLQSGQPFDLNAFTQLKSLEIDAKDAVSLGLINDFCTAWIANIVLNQPIRMNRDTLNCEIGHRLYKDAKAVW